jgi:hypothetical protein
VRRKEISHPCKSDINYIFIVFSKEKKNQNIHTIVKKNKVGEASERERNRGV